MANAKILRKKSSLFIGLLLGVSFMTHSMVTFAQTSTTTEEISKISEQPYRLDQLPMSKHINVLTYQMPYLSGRMQDATALIFYPKTEKPQDGWRIVVWTHGTAGVGDRCAPSKNRLNDNFKVAAEALLAQGYVIIAPDYEGLGTPGIHPYLHLESEARAAIYAVNSIKDHAPEEFQGDWMVVGQSQGGQASLGTAEYANHDPHFKGAVAGAPASNLRMIIQDVAPKAFNDLDALDRKNHIPLEERNSIHSFATVLAYGAFVGVGIKAEKPNFDYLDLFYPEAQPIAKLAEGSNGEDGLCLRDLREHFKADIIRFLETQSNARLTQYPGINSDTFQNHPTLIDFFEKSQPGTQKLDKPILIIQGEKDTNVPAVVTQKLVNNLVQLGSNDVELILVKDASHTEAIVWENDAVIQFVTEHMPAK